MFCISNRYTGGDVRTDCIEGVQGVAIHDDIISLPLFLAEPLYLAMDTTGFACFPSQEQAGDIYVGLDKVQKEVSVEEVAEEIRGQVLIHLVYEIKIYSDFLGGNVYGYVITNKAGKGTDNYWGVSRRLRR